MATNYTSSGRRITLAPTAPVASGAFAVISGFFGIPLNNRVAGQSVAFAIEGIWGMTWSFAAGDVGIGTVLYCNPVSVALSIGYSTGDVAVGKAVTAPDSTGLFQLLLMPHAPAGAAQQRAS